MLMLLAFKNPALKRLWFGQAFSSVGDEIYRVGLTWMAVGMIGADTGYLAAGQAAALMILSFIGGKWAEHWPPVSTMIRVDLVRAILVLIPVVYSFFAPMSLIVLVVVALLLAALSAFFDPALNAVLPQFSPDLKTLRAATGLMATTIRMARMVGPAIVGLLAGIISPIHFFTVDAFTFLISAYSLKPLEDKSNVRVRVSVSFSDALFLGLKKVRQKPGMTFVLISKAITGGTWALAFSLGFALLVQQMAGNDTRAFGMVVAAYGFGNFAGALYFGNGQRPRPALMMFIGYIWLGLGFIFIGLSPSIAWVMATSAFTGFSGTMNEVTFFDMVQTRFPISDLTRIFRLRMALDTSLILLMMLISPFLFRWLGVRGVLHLCGAVWIATGAIGLLFFLSHLRPHESPG